MRPFKADLDKSNLTLKVEGALSDSKTLYCDWTLYKHCLYNLVMNAIKYSKQGGQIIITFSVGQDGRLVTKISNTCEKKLNRKNFIQINKELSGEALHVESALVNTGEQRLKQLINTEGDGHVGMGLTNSLMIGRKLGA